MKNFLILFAFLITSCSSHTIVNLKAVQYAERHRVSEQWTNFSDWDSCGIDITMEKRGRLFWKKSTIQIMDKDTINLRVIGNVVETEDSTGREIMIMNCQDKKKVNCNIIMINFDEYVKMVLYYENYNSSYKLVLR